MYNTRSNQQSIKSILREEEESPYSGLDYNYVAILVFRLNLLFLRDSKAQKQEVKIKCSIVYEDYEKAIVKSKCKRYKGVLVKSNYVREDLCMNQNLGLLDHPTMILFDNREIIINLGAIESLLNDMTILYQSMIRQSENRVSELSKKITSTSSSLSDFRSTNSLDVNCVPKMPEIISVKNLSSKNEDYISWFEQYNTKNRVKYKEEALRLYNAYENAKKEGLEKKIKSEDRYNINGKKKKKFYGRRK